LLAAAVGLGAWYIVSNTAHNLEARGIASGFQFLSREAGFEISETTFISYDATSTYRRAIAVGFLNTFRVAAFGIVIATALGALIGIARLARNWLLAKLAAVYVELIRNVPLLVQLFFWYAIITEYLPAPGDALNPLPGVFLSNRGVVFPIPRVDPLHLSPSVWLAIALASGLGCASAVARRKGLKRGIGVGLTALAPVLLALLFVAGTPVQMSYPELVGFNFTGGGALSPEFAALLLGLVLYTGAFIAEIVRAGILAVERGQFEAAHSLGLSRWQAMRLVILPQALRAMLPPLTSQYLNITKNSSLAVAIGYPDLVSIANTIINQTGQAIEGIAIIMLAYLTVSLTLSALMNWYNRRVALKGGKP
jgi:general L-amino acid transport system permease protein